MVLPLHYSTVKMPWTRVFLFVLYFARSVSAVPAAIKTEVLVDLGGLTSACSLRGVRIPLPAGLSLATDQDLNAVTVGRGTQNYTCADGVFVSSGAVAK